MGLDVPPQHEVVANDLRRRLDNQEWAVGDRLPSRAQLAKHYGVGTNVLQKAQERLIVEGRLEGRAGSGTYVSKPRERRRMIRSRHREHRGGSPFRADMAELGRAGSWEAHSEARVPAPDNIAQRLGLDPGDPCVRTAYEFLSDSRPAQLSVSWEPMSITGGSPILLPEMGPLAGAGVVERMRSIGVDVSHTVEVPRPARATQEQANLLGISLGDMVLVIERTYYDGHGRAVETADIVIPETLWEVAYEFAIERADREQTT
ncbi:GntR family transcriptional regulator [Streptomyces krungchingensis]